MKSIRASLSLLIVLCGVAGAQSAPAVERITVDASAATTPFPHFWEQTFGSGREILSLRESYRNDLRSVKQITNFDSGAVPRDIDG